MGMYVFIFYSLFIIVLFFIPSYLTYKQTGINPFRFNSEESTINFVGKTYKLITLIAFIVIFINAFFSGYMEFLCPINYLQKSYLEWLGVSLLHLSAIWIFIAQRNMDNEWRIGIDNKNKVTLITKGLFSISRNPIFLGVIMVFIGLFLIIPNMVTTIILLTGIIVIQVQIRLEEEFLLKELGEEYMEYINKTKRWLL
jgi:protein-S-isoprenylcysteine O-methyltransferase Ste14